MPGNFRAFYPEVMKASRITCLAVLTGVVALLTGCGTESATDGNAVIKSLQLRVVVSEVDEACSAPPVTVDGPATACDRAGTTTYQLAKSLGTVTPTSTALSGDPSSSTSIALQLDKTDSATLAAATRKALKKRMAIVLNGEVLSAPQVMEPLTTGEVILAFGSSSAARQVNDELHARKTP